MLQKISGVEPLGHDILTNLADSRDKERRVNSAPYNVTCTETIKGRVHQRDDV